MRKHLDRMTNNLFGVLFFAVLISYSSFHVLIKVAFFAAILAFIVFDDVSTKKGAEDNGEN